MKKALCVCIITVCLISCSNKVNIDAPYKDITVVYGLLDQSDTAHYIRINKAFLGLGNALTMAQQYDSINYPIGSLTVSLKDYDVNSDSTVIPLTPTMNIPVSPGIFSYPNQVEYYTKQALNVNDQYKLIIVNNRTGKVVTGLTSLLPDIGLNFSISTISWDSNQKSIVSWSSIPNADIYQMTLRFFYTETAGSGSTLKYLDWVFFPQTTQDNNGGIFLIYQYTGQALLHLLHALIPPATLGLTRTADSLQVVFASGTRDFYTYFNLTQPPLGINQDKPFFSDVSNGVGMFTARHTQYVYKRVLSKIDNDSIASDGLTSNLGFAP